MMKAIRKMNPKANIAAIDYDPGASDVNQLNRIQADDGYSAQKYD